VHVARLLDRALEDHRLQVAVRVGLALARHQVLDERDALLQELGHLLVVETVGGRLLHRPAVHQRDPAQPATSRAKSGASLAAAARARSARTAWPWATNSRATSRSAGEYMAHSASSPTSAASASHRARNFSTCSG
jgi:hypothetical protein